jgi:hypothetical protein
MVEGSRRTVLAAHLPDLRNEPPETEGVALQLVAAAAAVAHATAATTTATTT